MKTVDGGRCLDLRYAISFIFSLSIMQPTANGPTRPAPTNPANITGLFKTVFLISYTSLSEDNLSFTLC